MLGSVLKSIAEEFTPAALASSLSAEDMVLTHAIARAGLPIGIFVLDTGRLNAETLLLVDEVKSLRKRFTLSADMPSMRAVGYRQVWEMLEKKTDAKTMRSRALAATRQLAKRQMTWLRSFPDLLRLDAGGAQGAAVALHLLLDQVGQPLGRAGR